MALSAILDCKRHSELDEVIYCELSVKSDKQLAISGYVSYGNQHYDDAESIVVGYRNIGKHFPIGIGKIFKSLKALDVSLSSLRFIERISFDNMDGLKELRLHHNEIQEFPADAFADLSNLEHLNIANNQIEKLDENLLSSLPKLKRFDAHNNNIQEFSGNIFKSNHEIREINLRGNKIKKIDLTIFETQNWRLSVFDLRENSQNCDLKFDSTDSNEKFEDFIRKVKNSCEIE